MTQEEKAKAYDKAIEKAKSWYADAQIDFKKSLETLFPELKKSEDERIRNVLLNDFKNNCSEYYCEGVNRDMIIAWLEKQGEQKPNDKVEPKFKVGDWITDGKALLHIAKFETDYRYELKAIDGEVFHFVSPNFVEANYHLWTIQDAKDGDVLAAHECYVIFKEIDGLNIKCYCTYHYMGFNPSFHINTLQNKTAFHPATKEQYNTMMKAMADAGYTFNFEKKELKKIKQEHTPKHKVGETIYYKSFGEVKSMIVANVVTDSTVNPMYEDENGSAVFEKDLIEQKPAWSEEDERILVDCFNILHRSDYPRDKVAKTVNWLKSLKERYAWKKSLVTVDLENSLCDIQDGYSDTSYEYRILGEAIEFIRRTEPQSQWKPSKEQIIELHRVISGCSYDIEPLVEIEKHLKKLMEE